MIQIHEKSEFSRFPKCKQVDDNECNTCIDNQGDESEASDKCCYNTGVYNQYYESGTKSCKMNLDTLCTTFNYEYNICTECAAGSYFSGEFCVSYGSYHERHNFQTKLINTLNIVDYPFKDSCQEITLIDLEAKKCSGCGTKFLRNNLCCNSIDELSI